jgi:phosphoserine phosphatase
MNPDNLESKISELAKEIKEYPDKKNKTKIRKLASIIDDNLSYGQRQRYKELLVEELDYNTKLKYTTSPKIETIANSIMFLKDLSIDDKKLIERFSNILAYKTEGMQERVDYLKKLGVKDIAKAVGRLPSILAHSIEGMQERVDYLKNQGVKNIAQVIRRLPPVLELRIERMQKGVNYLKKIGIKDIAKIIGRLPAVLAYSKEGMQERVDYLKDLGIKDIAKVIERAPPILEFRTEGMQERVDYLKKLGVRDIAKVVGRLPAVLTYSKEGMQEKIEYINKIGYEINEIENFPASLGYSLENRIIPRFEYLKCKNPGNSFNLWNILIPGDKYFAEKRAHSTLKDYLKFKEKYKK